MSDTRSRRSRYAEPEPPNFVYILPVPETDLDKPIRIYETEDHHIEVIPGHRSSQIPSQNHYQNRPESSHRHHGLPEIPRRHSKQSYAPTVHSHHQTAHSHVSAARAQEPPLQSHHSHVPSVHHSHAPTTRPQSQVAHSNPPAPVQTVHTHHAPTHAPTTRPQSQVAHSNAPTHAVTSHPHDPTSHGPMESLVKKVFTAHPNFRHSKCTGRKKALCIGINYIGQSHALHGCINDAKATRDFCINDVGISPENIILLTDESPNPKLQPTRKNMLAAMAWLVQDAQKHDSLFFHYSGHGGQTKDVDGDEIDGLDETIFPVDYHSTGFITDDTIHDIMVKPLPPGCRLTAIFDACHAGTVLDLLFSYSGHGRLRRIQVTPEHQEEKSSPADVIAWTACRDDQTSADTFEDGRAVGAMSFAFMKAIRENPGQSYHSLLLNTRALLQKHYKQIPQLGTSYPIDIDHTFILGGPCDLHKPPK
ncbi:hypothetical protein K439DRAFT_1626133 [Ramaria rubella]|nr:hypothetical protein K439DRAFT_1626133 [Ramaria rubella]